MRLDYISNQLQAPLCMHGDGQADTGGQVGMALG